MADNNIGECKHPSHQTMDELIGYPSVTIAIDTKNMWLPTKLLLISSLHPCAIINILIS